MHTLRNILLMAVPLLVLAACSSDGTLSEEHTVDLRQPMRFGSSSASAETIVTRTGDDTPTTPTYLESKFNDFKVGVWKGTTEPLQNVMDGYRVNHTTDHHWNYVGVNSQIERYWDLSAFPYEFRAVSPYNASTIITTDGITIDATTTPFTSEKHINYNVHVSALDASVTTVTEPFIVAHVKREKSGDDYVDTDIIKDNTEINSTGKADATREVHMPFHHLMSKIGFRIFIDNPQPTHSDYEVHIKDIIISVVDAKDKFVIASQKYTATNAKGLGQGIFEPIYPTGEKLTTKGDTYKYDNEYILLEHDAKYPYKETVDNVEKNLDFHNHLNKDEAFNLTPGELLMIPQSGVKLRVKLDMETKGVINGNAEFNFDSILRMETLNETDIPYDVHEDLWTWEPEKRYIYYLHIKNLHGHEIVLHTCEVLPWDEVQTTDIQIGL